MSENASVPNVNWWKRGFLGGLAVQGSIATVVGVALTTLACACLCLGLVVVLVVSNSDINTDGGFFWFLHGEGTFPEGAEYSGPRSGSPPVVVTDPVIVPVNFTEI